MVPRTQELIESLSEMDSRDEIDLEVNRLFEELKESLMQRGYEFEEYTGNFIGGQRIFGRDSSDYEFYNELLFIKDGLEDKWIARMDDYDNYKEIENSINDITIRFF